MQSARKGVYAACALLAVMAVLLMTSMLYKSPTYDEHSHLYYGFKLLRMEPLKTLKYDDSKMPVTALNTAAFLLSQKLMETGFFRSTFVDTGIVDDVIKNHLALLAARGVTIMAALLLGIYVYQWSRRLYGPSAALFALFLYVFSPNILAHGRLVTTDVYAALLITAALFHFWRFLTDATWKNAIISAGALGLAQLAKYTSVYLYLLFLLLAAFRFWPILAAASRARNMAQLKTYGRHFVAHAVVFVVISLGIINAGFLFYRTGAALQDYEFESAMFTNLQQLPLLSSLPLPLPYPYVQGLDMVRHHERTGSTFGDIYLLGRFRPSDGADFSGFKSYFALTLLFKEPIAIQICVALALLMFVRGQRWRSVTAGEWHILIPVLCFSLYFSVAFKAQIGVRFFVFLLPLLYIFCGQLAQNWTKASRKTRAGLLLLSLYLVVSVLSYHPHYISYFNEFVWPRSNAYKVVADSNLDWGQNELYLYDYLAEHPDLLIRPEHPVAGRLVVDVNALLGITEPGELYRWLRESCEPADHVAYSYLIYDTTPSSAQCDHAKLAEFF